MHKIGDKIRTIKESPCIYLKIAEYKNDNIIGTHYFDIDSIFRIIKVDGNNIYFESSDKFIYYIRSENFEEFFHNIRKDRKEKLQTIFKMK